MRMHPTCREYTPFAPRGSSLHPARRRMHPTCFPSCTPFAPQGKQKCTPPKSEMHPIYETLLNLFVIPNIRRSERKSTPFFLLHREDGTRRSKSQYAGGILLRPVQILVATSIFARPPQGQKCKRVPSGVFMHLLEYHSSKYALFGK